MNFEILRNMESFTQSMFDHIIAFQEKQHAAWNTKAPFAERIQNLPLHYLIFSNADRNPQLHGPTVAHYYPLRREIVSFAQYAKQVAAQPVILDLHARNGFIGSLLAREGVRVIGARDPHEKPNQIESFYDENNYEWCDKNIADINFPVDVVLASWTPSDNDDSETILRLKPKLVIFVYTEHINPSNGLRQTGRSDAFGERLANYRCIEEWSVTRPENIFHDVWPDLTPNLEETRIVKIFAAEEFAQIDRVTVEKVYPVYDWEAELLMAQTALEAKRMVEARGFPVSNF